MILKQNATSSIDKAAFAARLRDLMFQNGLKLTDLELTKHFNLRNPHRKINRKTAHAWLHGRNVPFRANMVSLADWLGTTVAYLEYGKETDYTDRRYSRDELQLLQNIRALSEFSRELVREHVLTLTRLESRARRTDGKQAANQIKHPQL